MAPSIAACQMLASMCGIMFAVAVIEPAPPAPPPPELPPLLALGICPLKSLTASTSKVAPAPVIFITISAMSKAVPRALSGIDVTANPEESAIASASPAGAAYASNGRLGKIKTV